MNTEYDGGRMSLEGALIDAEQYRPDAPIRLLECGCCGQFHPEGPLEPGGSANYKNDCRYDANRFSSSEEYEERTGKKAVEVWLDEQELELDQEGEL